MTTLFKTKIFACAAQTFILLCIFINVGCASSKIGNSQKKEIPLWANSETISQIFPEKDFIARIGSGKTVELAKLNADSELSSYFSASIKSSRFAEENFTSKNGNTSVSKNLQSNIFIQTDSELFALRHTEPYFDEKRGDFIMCAYINRKEAWNLLEPKLNSISKAINSFYSESQNETENFQKIMILNSVLKNSEKFYKLYFSALLIAPQSANNLSDLKIAESNILNAENKIVKLKQNSVVFVNVQGDSSSRIKTKIEEVFNENGFVVSESEKEKSFYFANANVAVKAEKSANGEIFSCYPQISISVKTIGGKTVFSFATQIEKVASYTKESCERMAFSKVEKEIEENFIKNLSGQ